MSLRDKLDKWQQIMFPFGNLNSYKHYTQKALYPLNPHQTNKYTNICKNLKVRNKGWNGGAQTKAKQ